MLAALVVALVIGFVVFAVWRSRMAARYDKKTVPLCCLQKWCVILVYSRGLTHVYTHACNRSTIAGARPNTANEMSVDNEQLHDVDARDADNDFL